MRQSRIVMVMVVAGLAGCGGGDPGVNPGGLEGLDLEARLELPTAGHAGDTLTARWEVRNVGTLPTPWVGEVRFGHEDTDWEAMAFVAQPMLIGMMQPGERKEGTAAISLPAGMAGGRYRAVFRLYLDDDYRLGNNEAEAMTTVSGAACTDDAYEDDDVQGEGPLMRLDEPLLRNFCFDGVDWSRFEATTGEQVGVRLVASGAPVSVRILGPGETWSATVFEAGAGEIHSARWEAPVDGTYTLQATVTGPYGAGKDYELALLPARSDPAVEAMYLQDNRGVNLGGVAKMRLDVDNLGYAMTDPTEVGWYLSTDDTLDPGDRLVDRHPLEALEEGSWRTLHQAVALPGDLPVGGDYWLFAQIDPDDALVELSEDNNVSAGLPLRLGAPDCAPDAHEEDDRSATAPAAVLGEVQTRNHCDDAHDWLALDAAAGEAFAITLTPDRTPRAVRVRALGPDGTVLVDETDSYHRVLSFTATAPGRHLVEVSVDAAGTDTGYTLLVTRALPDLTVSGWTDVSFGETHPGGLVSATVSRDNEAPSPSGDFVLRLLLSADDVLDAGDTPLRDLTESGLPGPSGRQGRALAPLPSALAPGTWFLFAQVDPEGRLLELDETNNHALLGTVDVTAAPCTADVDEEDDLPEEALTIALGTTLAGRNHCDDGTDWLVLPVTEGDPVAARLTGSTSSSDLEIHAPDGTRLARGSGTLDGGELYWVADRTGTVLLCAGCEVAPGRVNQTGYTLEVDLCPADAHEPDDSRAAARPITPGVPVSLNLCDGSDDYLTFQAVAGKSYQVTLTSDAGADAPGYGFQSETGASLTPDNKGWLSHEGTVYVRVRPVFAPTGLGSDYTVTLAAK